MPLPTFRTSRKHYTASPSRTESTASPSWCGTSPPPTARSTPGGFRPKGPGFDALPVVGSAQLEARRINPRARRGVPFPRSSRSSCDSRSSTSSTPSSTQIKAAAALDLQVLCWESGERARSNLKPCQHTDKLNEQAEAIQQELMARSGAGTSANACSPDVALKELTDELTNVDESLRGIQESSRKFGKSNAEDPKSDKEEAIPAKRRDTDLSLDNDDPEDLRDVMAAPGAKCGRQAAPVAWKVQGILGDLEEAAFTADERYLNTHRKTRHGNNLMTETEFQDVKDNELFDGDDPLELLKYLKFQMVGKERMRLQQMLRGGGTSGPMSRALQALESSDLGTSVHDVSEVQMIPSSTVRVETKVGYYRDHLHISVPLIKYIEKECMCEEANHGESIVNVSRLREMHRDRGRGSPLRDLEDERHDDQSGVFRAKSRSPSPSTVFRQRVMTPDQRSDMLENRALKHSERVERAVRTAREIHMDRRLEHLKALNFRQKRCEQAARARPWISIFFVIMAAVTLRTFWQALRKSDEVWLAIEKNREVEGWDRTGTQLWRELALRMQIMGNTVFVNLKDKQLQLLQRLLWKRRIADRTDRKKDRVWRNWMLLMRLMTFVVRIRRPLFRHNQMDMIKDFVSCSWRGAKLRISVKVYMKKMRLLENCFRQSFQLMQLVRFKVLHPQVWAMESLVLGQAVGIHEEVLRAEILEYTESCEIEKHKLAAQQIMAERHQAFLAGHVVSDRSALGRNTTLADNCLVAVQLAKYDPAMMSASQNRKRGSLEESRRRVSPSVGQKGRSAATPRGHKGQHGQNRQRPLALVPEILEEQHGNQGGHRGSHEPDGINTTVPQHTSSANTWPAPHAHHGRRPSLQWTSFQTPPHGQHVSSHHSTPNNQQSTPMPTPHAYHSHKHLLGTPLHGHGQHTSRSFADHHKSPHHGDHHKSPHAPHHGDHHKSPHAWHHGGHHGQHMPQHGGHGGMQTPQHGLRSELFGLSMTPSSSEHSESAAPMSLITMRRHQQVARTATNTEEQHTGSHSRGMLAVVDRYRLTHQERDEICMAIWRTNLDRWWHAFLAYKADRAAYSGLLQTWARAIIEIGAHHKDMWPERPIAPHYPQELMKVHQPDLRRQITYKLREGAAASIL